MPVCYLSSSLQFCARKKIMPYMSSRKLLVAEGSLGGRVGKGEEWKKIVRLCKYWFSPF